MRKSVLPACAAIAALTAAAFAPVVRNGFVWDDLDYLVQNARLPLGFTAENLRWAFTTFHSSNWHPLTWLSHLLDYRLFGLAPAGHHLVNLAIHVANALLAFLVFHRMTGARWPSAALAALFAVHPLRVESVAWAAERKDVLSAFWGWVAIAAHLRHARRPGASRYLAVLAAFALGLLAKPMLVTLPFVLLLLDGWPLGRLAPGRRGAWVAVAEKLPMLALSAASSVLTYLAQASAESIMALPPPARAANAATSYVRYLFQAAWPFSLAPIYPHPLERYSPGLALGALALLGAATALVLRARRRAPHLVTGWLWYLGTLVPVIGVVQVGTQARADRYTYVPLVGLLVMAGWGAYGLRDRRRAWGAVRAAAPILVLVAAAMTNRQVRHWRDTGTLFGHALAVTEGNCLAHYNLGVALLGEGRTAEAERHYREAIVIYPEYAEARNNLGGLLSEQGRKEEAAAEFAAAVRARPGFAGAHHNLAVTLAALGRPEEGLRHDIEAVRLDPRFAAAHFSIGSVYARLGRTEEAAAAFAEAARIDPASPFSRNNLGTMLASLARLDEAAVAFAEAVRRKPDYIEALFNLGSALALLGRGAEAVAPLETLVRIQPDFPDARRLLEQVRAGIHPAPATDTVRADRAGTVRAGAAPAPTTGGHDRVTR